MINNLEGVVLFLGSSFAGFLLGYIYGVDEAKAIRKELDNEDD